jgi:hypothetical protein
MKETNTIESRPAPEAALDRPRPSWEVIIPDYKGYTIRRCRKGYLAFQGGNNLYTCDTVDQAIKSVDRYLECKERQREADRLQEEARIQREREDAERERLKREAVLATIAPIRDFVSRHGLDLLRNCVAQLEQEERDRNVPQNWQALVELCERIGEKRTEEETDWGHRSVGEVDVTKYGVTEYYNWNSRADCYLSKVKYGLHEYIDRFGAEYLEERPMSTNEQLEKIRAAFIAAGQPVPKAYARPSGSDHNRA